MKKTEFSLEVFPPKVTDGIEHIYGCLENLASLKPDFISVTYSAGNAKKGLTAEVCEYITNKYSIKAVSHLTCTGATKESIREEIENLKKKGTTTVLALRGDITPEKNVGEFKHATDLMEGINAIGGITLYGACYPEGHVESGSVYQDLSVLKAKFDLGVEKFISQLFFKNADFLRMRDMAVKAGITAKFSAGIMPATSAVSIVRMVNLSGAKIPPALRELIDKYGESKADMRKAGIEYAIRQIRELISEGADIHLYTMDNALMSKEIYDGIKDLI